MAFALVGQVMAEHATLLDKMRELATLSVEQRLVAVLSRLARQKMFMDSDGQIIAGCGPESGPLRAGQGDARVGIARHRQARIGWAR